MTSAPSPSPPLRRRVDPLVALLVLVVCLEALWIIVRTPTALVEDTRGTVVLQGEKPLDDERGGELVPGPQPPHMAHGEGRGGGEPMANGAGGVPGVGVPGQPMPPGQPQAPNRGMAAAPALGRPAAPAPGKPSAPAPPTGIAAPAGPPDAYHEVLAGILAVNAHHPLDRNQARRLLAVVRRRESLRSSDVGDAAHLVVGALTPAQRAFVTRMRDDRTRQGKPPSPPETLPRALSTLLATWKEHPR